MIDVPKSLLRYGKMKQEIMTKMSVKGNIKKKRQDVIGILNENPIEVKKIEKNKKNKILEL